MGYSISGSGEIGSIQKKNAVIILVFIKRILKLTSVPDSKISVRTFAHTEQQQCKDFCVKSSDFQSLEEEM